MQYYKWSRTDIYVDATRNVETTIFHDAHEHFSVPLVL